MESVLQRVAIMDFKVVISMDEDGFYIAECIDLPGCVSDGKTRQEAESNIKEAIGAYIESLEKHNEKIPSRNSEVVEVSVCT